MNLNKILGLCIIVFALVGSANAVFYPNNQSFNNWYNSYDNGYSDGSFNVTYDGGINTSFTATDAGSMDFYFNVTGSGTYTIVVAMESNAVTNSGTMPQKLTQSATTSSNNVGVTFDGNYFMCSDNGWGSTNSNGKKAFTLDVQLYQSNELRFQKQFKVNELCKTAPVTWDCKRNPGGCGTGTSTIRPIGSIPYQSLNLTLGFTFREIKTYTIGAYISDNKGGIAYAENSVTTTANGQTHTLQFIFDANQLRNLNLTNEKPTLQTITVDGNYVKYETSMFDEFKLGQNLSSNDFATTRVSSVVFDTANKINGKITQLDVIINAANAPSTYTAEFSLENTYGEYIDTKQTMMTGGVATASFNGTDIYHKQINGPYRIGFIRLTNGGTEYLYETNKGESSDLSYTNFTAPPQADIVIKDSSVVSDSVDVNVTVTNNGTETASGTTITLLNTLAQKVGEIIIAAIPAGQSYTYKFSGVGISSATAIGDFANIIEETNESNNVGIRIAGTVPLSINGNAVPTSGNTPLNVTFTSSASGGNGTYTYRWDFTNDGTYDMIAQNPSFIYNTAGSFTARVNVTDSLGATAQTTITINTALGPSAPAFVLQSTVNATRGTSYVIPISGSDANGDSLTFSSNDSRFVITPTSATTANVAFTAQTTEFGKIPVVFSVTDGTFMVNQSVLVILQESSYTLKAATLDYATQQFINSTISVNAQSQNTTQNNLYNFTLNSNTEYAVTHTSQGYVTDPDYVYFDTGLTSCETGMNCSFNTGGHITICEWQSNSNVQLPMTNSWYCSIEGGTLEKKTWFRYAQTPEHYARRFNYLLK